MLCIYESISIVFTFYSIIYFLILILYIVMLLSCGCCDTDISLFAGQIKEFWAWFWCIIMLHIIYIQAAFLFSIFFYLLNPKSVCNDLYKYMLCTLIINVLQSLSLHFYTTRWRHTVGECLCSVIDGASDTDVTDVSLSFLVNGSAQHADCWGKSERRARREQAAWLCMFLSSSTAHKYCVNDRLSSWNLHVSSPKLRVRASDMCLAQHLLRCLRFMHLLWFMIP